MSGGQWMVVLIVAIVMIAKIVRMGMNHEDKKSARFNDPEAGRLRDEVRTLKERLAVLERIATDGNTTLERQIEALRDGRDDSPPLPARDQRRDRAEHREA